MSRALVYVQHLLGIGHYRRAATLAAALADGGFDTTLVSGGLPVPGISLGGAQLAQLPPARAVDTRFKKIVDEDDRPIDEAWRARRRTRLLELFRQVRPDAIIIEMFPFGRRHMSFELIPLLEMAETQRPRPVVFCSVRDILVEKSDPQRSHDMVALARRYIDHVLVHGDPRLIPFEQTFEPARQIADRLIYTGYVVAPSTIAVADPAIGRDEVLVSAGGGAVGGVLLEAALGARALSTLNDRTWRLLVGHGLPEDEFQALAARAGAGIVIERARPDFPALLERCALSISQGGYNTVMEILAARARAVVVPFAATNGTEQIQRAELLAARGRLVIAPEQSLDAASLARAVDAAMAAPTPSALDVDLDGAAASSRLVSRAVAARRAA
jgi:predicted glycosyltransferase